EQAKFLREEWPEVDLIITDHHRWKDTLPDCYEIVHPALVRGSSGHINPDLCGAGVAFKLAWAIGQAMAGGDRVSADFKSVLQELLAFSCLGTIADCVSLTGENRIIAHHGLR